MKKLKIIIVSLLAVILCVMCVTTSTFSWFARPQTQRAEKFGWNVNYDISQGSGISMTTYSGSLDTYGNMNYSNVATSFSSDDLAAGNANYFRTDIKNTGDAAQSVSLFITSAEKNEGSQGKFYLGVNSPTKTYKPYIDPISDGKIVSTGNKTSTNKMRIYFEDNNSWIKGGSVASDKKTYANLNASGSDYHALKVIGDDQSPYNGRKWYYDVPTNQGDMFFSMQDYDVNQPDQRTAILNPVNDGISQSVSKVYKCTTTNNSSGQRTTELHDVQGANFVQKYRTISLNAKNTFNASLESGVDYFAKTISYYSGDPDVFTVDENGVITGVSAGEAKLYTKITGDTYGDSWQEETTVKVYPASVEVNTLNKDIPVVTNLKIEPAVDSSNPTIVSVYWYIKNDSSTGSLSYKIDGLYLTL